jgi:hypothetical protein
MDSSRTIAAPISEYFKKDWKEPALKSGCWTDIRSGREDLTALRNAASLGCQRCREWDCFDDVGGKNVYCSKSRRNKDPSSRSSK